MLKKNIIKLEDYRRNLFSNKIDCVYIDVDAIDIIEVNSNTIRLYTNGRCIYLIRKTVYNIKSLKHFGLIGDDE